MTSQLRVEAFEEAEGFLLGLLEDDPEYYSALLDMGVLKKKQGDYAYASAYIEKALKINPEGHLGIGDWYLRMLAWRVESREDAMTQEHFLSAWMREENIFLIRDLDIERLFLVVKNDQAFSDGFYVLGTRLMEPRDFHLAYIALTRAK